MTVSLDSKPRRPGRPCKEPPWLREVAEMVGRGTPLRRALWRHNVLFTERELKGIYRLKRFREYYEAAKIALYQDWRIIPRRQHTSVRERYIQAKLESLQLENYLKAR